MVERIMAAAAEGEPGRWEDWQIFTGMVAAGGDFMAQDGLTPLHYAVLCGNARAVKELAEAGAPLQAATFNKGWTPLHMSMLKGDPGTVAALLEAGADANAGDKNSSTPLHMATQIGFGEAIGLLLAAGADFKARNIVGATPLDWAAYSGNAAAVAALLEAGADPAPYPDGWTSLHYAAAWGESKGLSAEAAAGKAAVARMLVAAGVDPRAADGDGDTPLSLARQAGLEEVVAVLLGAGAADN